jgi:hypothetical protein
LSESDFENSDIQAYLMRPLEENIEKDKEIENKVKAAVYLATRRSKWKPRATAKKLAEASVEALRDARLITLYESNQITAKQYNEELENNQVSKIATTFKRVKKRYARKTVKAALSIAIGLTCGGPAGAIASGIMLASELIPKNRKEKIKRNIKRNLKKIGEAVTDSVSRLCSRAASSAPKIVEKIQETVHTVTENVSTYVAPIIDTCKEFGSAVARTAKKIWAKIFS